MPTQENVRICDVELEKILFNPFQPRKHFSQKELEQLAEKIQHRMRTKVNIQGKGSKGRITINYYNLDDLDRLLNIFGVTEE